MDNEKICKFAEKVHELAQEMGIELRDFGDGISLPNDNLGWFQLHCREVKHEG